MTYTKGPWHVVAIGTAQPLGAVAYVPSGLTVVADRDVADEWEANARLIASAPEMRAELERTLATLRGWLGEARTDCTPVKTSALEKLSCRLGACLVAWSNQP
jgi:hypothetical protein